MTRLPPLNALRCFDAAARHRSFSKAAAELHVTQSAISHQVRLLEEWFGTKLFTRSSKETLPTLRGQDLAESLASAFRIIAEGCRRAESSENDGGLTVAVLPSIATIWLIPRLQAFFTAYPKIPLKIVYAIHGRLEAQDDVDVSITWGAAPDAPGLATPLLPGNTVAVGNPALVARLSPALSLANLVQAPLLHDVDKSGWQIFMRKAGIKHAGPIAGPVFEDFNLLRAAVLAGQGLALCPRSLVADDVAAGRLTIQFPAIEILNDHKYWLIEAEQSDERKLESIQSFKTWIREAAAHNFVGP